MLSKADAKAFCIIIQSLSSKFIGNMNLEDCETALSILYPK